MASVFLAPICHVCRKASVALTTYFGMLLCPVCVGRYNIPAHAPKVRYQ